MTYVRFLDRMNCTHLTTNLEKYSWVWQGAPHRRGVWGVAHMNTILPSKKGGSDFPHGNEFNL